MQTEEHTLTFIGEHPISNKPMCGVLTDEFDVEHVPFEYQVEGDSLIIFGQGKGVRFIVPQNVIEYVHSGVEVYVANVNGREEVHIATRRH